MNDTNCGGKGLTTELKSLFTELMRSEEESHIKIDQHQDGHMSFAIYVGDKSIYESSECYETEGIVLCQDKGLSFRVKELRADDTEQFISLGIYDKEDHLGTYAVKLGYQQSQGEEFEGHDFIIHDIFATNSLI